MNDGKTCMVISCQNIDSAKTKYVRQELEREIMQNIKDGYTNFIIGFTRESVFSIADIISEFKKKYSIKLEIAIPYRTCINKNKKRVQEIIRICDAIYVHSESYTPSCFMSMNRFMTQMSNRIIVVYDGKANNSVLFVMQYAHILKKDVRIISI